MPGTLYVVATPIGNLADMTPRAVDALRAAELIAAEDTRVTAVLLRHFGIDTPAVSYHAFNERERAQQLVARLIAGGTLALVSDAGTPCISDPGTVLVREAVQAGAQVIGVCGASAAITAVSVSALPADSFAFYGFFPREKAAARAALRTLAAQQAALGVYYESPHRVVQTVALLAETLPAAQLCLCNDLSKMFERLYRGTPAQVLAELAANPNTHKGEYTLVVQPNAPAPAPADRPSAEAQLVDAMVKQNLTARRAIDALAAREDAPYTKKQYYAASLALKARFAPQEDT